MIPSDNHERFLLYGKTCCSGGKSNGTVLFTGNFSEKSSTFGVIPLFSEYQRTICVFTLVPCSLMKHAVCLWNNDVMFHLAENSDWFSLQMESAPPVRFYLWENCTVPFGRKFSPVFPFKWKVLRVSTKNDQEQLKGNTTFSCSFSSPEPLGSFSRRRLGMGTSRRECLLSCLLTRLEHK